MFHARSQHQVEFEVFTQDALGAQKGGRVVFGDDQLSLTPPFAGGISREQLGWGLLRFSLHREKTDAIFSYLTKLLKRQDINIAYEQAVKLPIGMLSPDLNDCCMALQFPPHF
jgi:hypothetical protein